MNKIFLISLLVLVFTSPLNLNAEKKKGGGPGKSAITSTTLSATVESIDYKTRYVTLKGEDGEKITLKVGPLAHNFNQVKKGDTVTFEYLEAVAIDVQKADGDLKADAKINIKRAPKGSSPAGIITETLTLKASVDEIDYKSRIVTLKGPEGNKLTLKIGKQAKRFKEVKKGDQVVVQYTEALGISVTTPKG